MAAIAAPVMANTRSRVLIASADPIFRQRVMNSPAYFGALSEEAVGGAHALAKLLQVSCDSVVLDRNLPDLDAREVAEQIRRQFPRVSVELLEARAGSSAQEMIPHVVPDVEAHEVPNVSPSSVEELRPEQDAEHEGRQTPGGRRDAELLPGMIGSSRAMEQVYRLVRMVAGRDTAVLITGETGTGKELVAGAIHQLSRRSRNPLVVVNCAAIPEALLEAELFGHVRGAFTGAVQSRLGRIHVAQGGTLFLDEVGELPLAMQAKLLRFLQNGEVQRLGSSDVYRVDVRVICATNVPLLEQVQAKQFRQDLYYRLAVFLIELPPLLIRTGDVAELANHFLKKFSEEAGFPLKKLTPAALGTLEQRRWPGNVRELQHVLERGFILSGNSREICAQHVQMGNEAVEVREV